MNFALIYFQIVRKAVQFLLHLTHPPSKFNFHISNKERMFQFG